MKLGIMLGYSGSKVELPIDMIKEADELGVDVVWAAEAYGSDAVTPLAWIGALTKRIKLATAIMQMPGRTPANPRALPLREQPSGSGLRGQQTIDHTTKPGPIVFSLVEPAPTEEGSPPTVVSEVAG